MSSFFTVPGAQKKRKRAPNADAPQTQKRAATSKPHSTNSKSQSRPVNKSRPENGGSRAGQRDRNGGGDDSSISGSDSESGDDAGAGHGSDSQGSDDDGSEDGETAAEKRLRLAERYLENVRHEVVDEAGFDAADLDRDIIAERLQEDVAESKGKVYKQLAPLLSVDRASHCFFRADTTATTAIAACHPHVYTVSKDRCLIKWLLQDLPQNQFPQTTRRKPKKAPAPPRLRPVRLAMLRGDSRRPRGDRSYDRHSADILCVAASADGRFVVTGGADSRLVVYDAPSLKPLRVFHHHRDAVTALAFRRGSNQLYSASRDRTVKVWSLNELAYVETLFGHQDHVVDVDALAHERCLSVGARDRTARLWKVVEETQLVFRGGALDRKNLPPVKDRRSLAHEGNMDRVAMLDEDLFVTGSDNGSLCLWSTQKKKPLFVLPQAHGLDPELKPSDVSAEQCPDPDRVVPPPQPRWITALRALPYSDVVLSGSWDGHVRAWRLSDDKKKLEPLGVLGARSPAGPSPLHSGHPAPQTQGPEKETNEGASENGKSDNSDMRMQGIVAEPAAPCAQHARGVVNDIAVFERGDRGRDGLCVVVAVAKEHRLGRWKLAITKGAKNGAIVFEIPRMSPPVGIDGDSTGIENA